MALVRTYDQDLVQVYTNNKNSPLSLMSLVALHQQTTTGKVIARFRAQIADLLRIKPV